MVGAGEAGPNAGEPTERMRQRAPLMPGAVEADVSHFREHGYCVVRGIVGQAELVALREETYAQVSAGPSREPRSDYLVKDLPGGGEAFFRIQFLTDKAMRNDSLLRALANPRIIARVAALLGPDWTTYGSAMVFKGPGGGPAIELHRDVQPGALFPPEHLFFNVDLYLDPAGPDSGCLKVLPGSHRERDVREELALGLAHPGLVDVPMEPGDVLFHDAMLLHGSLPTGDGGGLRRVLYYSYQSAAAMLADGVLPGLVPPRRWVAQSMRLVQEAAARRASGPYAGEEAVGLPAVPAAWTEEVAATPLELRPVAGNLPWEKARS